MIIEDYAQRMFHEYAELADRTMKLHQYLTGQDQKRDICRPDYDALQEQLSAMGQYAQILGTRLTKYFNELDYTL